MKYQRLLIMPLFVAGLLAVTVSLHYAYAVAAQQKEQTTQTAEGSKTDTTTPTGFPTGTTCTKSGTYRASNKYMEVIIVVEDGEEFPPFTDGQKTTWYALTPSTKSSFEPVKVTAGDN
jgi:hypothetical protein